MKVNIFNVSSLSFNFNDNGVKTIILARREFNIVIYLSVLVNYSDVTVLTT